MSEDEIRLAIRDAMVRLADGKPLRSDGKLTVKSLAEEAGVKRWVLTHKFTDLQGEFRAVVETVGSEPAQVRRLREQLAQQDAVITSLRSEIRELKEDRSQLERVINVLGLENFQLRDKNKAGVPDLNAERNRRGG